MIVNHLSRLLGERHMSVSELQRRTGIPYSSLHPLARGKAQRYDAKTLDAIEEDGVEAESISLSSPPGGTPAGAVACFHYRTLLVIPDIDRSPFPVAAKHGDRSPKSLLFVPMIAQSEVIGVLELDQDDRVRDFTADEQALAQHLGHLFGDIARPVLQVKSDDTERPRVLAFYKALDDLFAA
jgi:GAF domain-containing protein